MEALGLAGNPRVLGLQFDNHAGAADVGKWLEHDGPWALSGSGADPQSMVDIAAAKEETMGRLFRRFMGNFLQLA